jgi:hypothetical protein
MLIPARGSVDASSDPVVARTKRRASRGFEDDAQRPRHITSEVQSIFLVFPSFLLLLLFEKFSHVGLLLLPQTFSGILVN